MEELIDPVDIELNRSNEQKNLWGKIERDITQERTGAPELAEHDRKVAIHRKYDETNKRQLCKMFAISFGIPSLILALFMAFYFTSDFNCWTNSENEIATRTP